MERRKREKKNEKHYKFYSLSEHIRIRGKTTTKTHYIVISGIKIGVYGGHILPISFSV